MESLICIYRWLTENSRNLSQCGLLSFTSAKQYSFKNVIRNISMSYIRFSLKIHSLGVKIYFEQNTKWKVHRRCFCTSSIVFKMISKSQNFEIKFFLSFGNRKEYDTPIFILFLKIRARYIIKDLLDLFFYFSTTVRNNSSCRTILRSFLTDSYLRYKNRKTIKRTCK